jgi:hypothetical protein
MAFLSQAFHLGSLLLPHNAFQEHAAHPAEWSAELNSKGSERTCIRSGLATFLHNAFMAHPDFVVRSIPHSAKASGGENLDVKEPVVCWYSPAFHLHPTLPSMLSATLIGDQIIEVRQPCQKHLLAPFGMMEALHREQFPLEGVMRLIEQGTGRRHLGICEDGIPAYLFVLEPAPDPLPVGHPCCGGNVVGKVTESLTRANTRKPLRWCARYHRV